jgi:hypothetical protein
MRKVPVAKLSSEEKTAKAEALSRAWTTLISAGPKGTQALKEELRNVNSKGEKDDFFRLGAAAVLWQIGKADESETIAGIWASADDLSTNYTYVFFTVFEAACSQDPKVAPMLIQSARDRKGSVFISQHFMTVAWPLNQQFIWGAYGPKGIPALERLLEEGKDETSLATAILLLCRDQDLKSLAKIRGIAKTGSGLARTEAIKALGHFGHPDDFGFLIDGLEHANSAHHEAFVYAAYEFGDLRAVPLLIPKLGTTEESLGMEVVGALRELLTLESLEALQAYGSTGSVPRRKEACTAIVKKVLEFARVESYEIFHSLPVEKKLDAITAFHDDAHSKYRLKPDDKPLSHDGLLEAAAEWKKNHRITGGTFEWVEDRHLLGAAGPSDIPLLLEVVASCSMRLSDECLYEISTLQKLAQIIGRTRYRKTPFVCQKVEPSSISH